MSAAPSSASTFGHGQFCTECGYDLRALTSERCPECGTPLDRGTISETRLPWMRRKRGSIALAYLATVWLAFVKPRKLAEEIRRPVSYREARKFQLITILIALVPIVALITHLYFANLGGNRDSVSEYDPYVSSDLPVSFKTPVMLPDWIFITTTCAGAFLFLLFATGFPSYAFHPAEIQLVHQNRSVALSYYACAPLAFMPITVTLLWLAIVEATDVSSWRRMNVLWFYPLTAIAVTLPFVQLFHWWISTVVLHHRTTLSTIFRSTIVAMLLPAGWITLALIFLAIFPASIFATLIYLFSP